MNDIDRTTIGRYELITMLAHGGMAEIHLAREHGIAGLQRVVVIKKMLPQLASDPEFVEMFLREARIAAKIQHPNIVEIFELGKDKETYYIAMEYIRGTTTREIDVLAQKMGGSVPLNIAVALTVGALRGLHVAHELKNDDGENIGLIHRDISPHNIMCTSDGHVKLLDFGIAKSTEKNLEATYSGNLKGKFAYMSPEQCLRNPLDRRSDLFSMGIVLWELVAGERLFKRNSEMEMMQAITSGDLKIPKRGFHPELAAILTQALHVDKNKRFFTAEIFRFALQDFAQKDGLDISVDAIGDFVNSIAGTQLNTRDQTVKIALDRKLSASERRNLMYEESESISRSSSIPLYGETFEPPTKISPHKTASKIATGVNQGSNARISIKRASTYFGFVAIGAIALGIIVWAIFRTPSKPVYIGENINIAWAPTINPEVLRTEILPLTDLISTRLETPVVLSIPHSYEETSEKLLNGDVHFAVLPPLLYLRTIERNAKVQPVAMKMYQGSKHSDGLLLVASNSKVKTVAGLKGKTFCLTDKNSTTGNFLPRVFFEEKNTPLDTFAGKIVWSGDHVQAIRDLLEGKCDAAATYSGALISASYLKIPVAQIRTLAITGHTPQDVFCAGPGTDPKLIKKVKKILLSLEPQKEWNREFVGKIEKITGFSSVIESDFADLRKIVNKKK